MLFLRELSYTRGLVYMEAGHQAFADLWTNAFEGSQRLVDERALQNANIPTPFPGRTDAPLPLFYWTPCIDGKLLEDLPYRMFEQGRFIDVPILLGTDNDGKPRPATLWGCPPPD